MLHEKTVEAGTLALIKKLSSDKVLNNFVLVGGTALALQLGHRKSIDIDLFTPRAFDAESLARRLETVYRAQLVGVLGNTVTSEIDDVRTMLMAHQYPWVKPPQTIDGIRIASLEDIGAMKFNAIINSGTRIKDYIDVYALLQQRNLGQLMDAYTKKYQGSSPVIAKNALLYHKEIDFGTDVKMMGGPLKWPEVVKRLKEALREPRKVFQNKDVSANERKDQGEDVSKGLRRGRAR